MIASLTGQISYKSALVKKDNFVVVDVQGVGYKVYVTDRTLNQLKLTGLVSLLIYTQVGETTLDLYGFLAVAEKEIFELLISISGIGPRSALGILQKASVADLQAAAQSGDHHRLSKLAGLGPKTALKVTQGLKDKVGSDGVVGDWSGETTEALDALVGLGYNIIQAREALAQVTVTEVGEQIRAALKLLAK